MKRDSVSAYEHMKRDTLSPFWMIPSIPLVTYILNGWPVSQPKDK